MVLVGFKTDKNLNVVNFINEMKDKLSEDNLVNNPFKANTHVLSVEKSIFVFLNIKTIYPTIWYFMLIPIAVGIIFNSLFWIWLGLILTVVTGFFYTSFFYMLFIFLGLRKKGYKGKVHFLSFKTMAEVLAFGSR